MCGVVLKSADQLEISDELFGEVSASISSVMEADEYEDAEERLCETLESLADYARRGKRSHNDVLRQQMLDLVAEEYSDPQLSLTSAADRLGISESYLSHFFKEQTGRNFHVYLEELRMKRACELLKTTSVPVVQIATAVGYSSSNTFGRAFRRVHGMNATTHRRRSRVQ
jgi:AraC-like DNA-binding protein